MSRRFASLPAGFVKARSRTSIAALLIDLCSMPTYRFDAMRIRYSRAASVFIRQIRERSEDRYHSLRGLIIQLASDPEIDNKLKVLHDFGSGNATPVYMDEEWWIVYRVNRPRVGEETLSVIIDLAS